MERRSVSIFRHMQVRECGSESADQRVRVRECGSESAGQRVPHVCGSVSSGTRMCAGQRVQRAACVRVRECGSDTFGSDRSQFSGWKECEGLLPALTHSFGVCQFSGTCGEREMTPAQVCGKKKLRCARKKKHRRVAISLTENSLVLHVLLLLFLPHLYALGFQNM